MAYFTMPSWNAKVAMNRLNSDNYNLNLFQMYAFHSDAFNYCFWGMGYNDNLSFGIPNILNKTLPNYIGEGYKGKAELKFYKLVILWESIHKL